MPINGTGHQGTTLARAAEATNRLRDEIDQLWCDSVNAADGPATERLVAVSHAIRHVSDMLGEVHVIG